MENEFTIESNQKMLFKLSGNMEYICLLFTSMGIADIAVTVLI